MFKSNDLSLDVMIYSDLSQQQKMCNVPINRCKKKTHRSGSVIQMEKLQFTFSLIWQILPKRSEYGKQSTTV